MALRLVDRFPQLKCWAFGPPGALPQRLVCLLCFAGCRTTLGARQGCMEAAVQLQLV